MLFFHHYLNPCSDMASTTSLQLEEDLSHFHQVIHPESKPQAVFINNQLNSSHTYEHTVAQALL